MAPPEPIRIGRAGWSYQDWEGTVYPKGLKRRQHPVAFLAQYFDLIEINTSFYGHIKPGLGRQWSRAAEVNPEFLFTAKLNRAFTHSPVAVVESTSAATIKPNPEDESLAKAGLDSIAAENKLGALLIQFPVSFKNTEENRAYLASLLERFREYPRVVEIRHATWNDQQTLRAFAEQGVGFCNIDQPILGRSLRPTAHVTSPVGYVRLHGRRYDQWFTAERPHDRYDYLYTADELQWWKGRIDQVAEKAEKTFVVTNNHYKGKAAANAVELKRMLGQRPVKAPATLIETYPRLREVVDSETSFLSESS